MGNYLHILNQPISPSPQKTIIVLGAGRGGTSALAGTLRELGVAMPNAHPLKHEWSPIHTKDGEFDSPTTYENIRSLDKTFDVWGWKRPGDVFLLDRFQSELRNPFLLIVFRNLLDACQSSARHDNVPWELVAPDHAQVYSELCRLLTHSALPIGAVSFEQMLAHPRETVLELNSWLTLTDDQRNIDAAANFLSGDQAYKSVRADPHEGVFASEDLHADSLAAHHTLYSKNMALIEAAMRALEDDVQNAQKVETHLATKINEVFKANEKLFRQADTPLIRRLAACSRELFLERFVNEPRMSEEISKARKIRDVTADVPSAPDSYAGGVEIDILQNAYVQMRNEYRACALRRRALQRNIQDLHRNLLLAEELGKA